MVYSFGELGVEIDFGTGEPGATLQHEENGYWHDYLVGGEPVTNPLDVSTLPPGTYRLRDKP